MRLYDLECIGASIIVSAGFLVLLASFAVKRKEYWVKNI